MKYYLLYNRNTGKWCCGTDKHFVPKLYTLGSAKSSASYRNNANNYDQYHGGTYNPGWEVVEVKVIISDPEKFFFQE